MALRDKVRDLDLGVSLLRLFFSINNKSYNCIFFSASWQYIRFGPVVWLPRHFQSSYECAEYVNIRKFETILVPLSLVLGLCLCIDYEARNFMVTRLRHHFRQFYFSKTAKTP